MPQQTFSIDDLIEHIDNAREFRVLTGPSTGTLWGTEFKHSETAVKTDKAINYSDGLGYMYFISPKGFGDVNIFNAINANAMESFTRVEREIDSVQYIVYYHTNPMTASASYDFTMKY